MITKTRGTETDGNGYAPGNVQDCDARDCRTCTGLGWILCDHQGAEIEDDWCTRCGAPADELRTWTWCPEREN
jgi:hypothetical protein